MNHDPHQRSDDNLGPEEIPDNAVRAGITRRTHQAHGGGAPAYYGSSHYGYGYGYGHGYPGYGTYEGSGMLGRLTLRGILAALRRRWFIVAGMGVLGVLGAVLYLRLTDPVYRARSMIEMTLRQPKILDAAGAMADEGYASSQEAFNTRLAKFRGRGLRPLVQEKFRELSRERGATRFLHGNVPSFGASINVQKGTRLISITVHHTDPELAALGANAYALAAQQSVFDENEATSRSAVAWLQEQAAAQEKLLAKTEKALADFRAGSKLDVLEGRKKSAEDSIVSLNGALAGLQSQAVLLSDMKGFLDEMDTNPKTAANLPPDLPREAQISAALDRWQEAMTERAMLARRYQPEHPTMRDMDRRLKAMENQILVEVRIASGKIENNIDLLEKQAGSLQAQIEKGRQTVAELEQQIVQHRSKVTAMERERDACDIAYRGILKRIEEARLSADENTALVKVVDHAGVPSSPIKPKPASVILMAVFLALGGGVGLVVLTDLLDDRITSFTDIEQDLGLQVMAVIPRVPKANRNALATATLNDRFSAVAETFSGIRNLLDSARYRALGKTVLIASSGPEEGKTICACNLAVAFARSGTRTLLVDFDLRRPRLRTVFGLNGTGESLMHTLASEDATDFGVLPVSGVCENLDVVVTKSDHEHSPAELIGGRKVNDFMQWAEKHYDRIVVDSPPLGLVSDTAVLAGLSGCVLLVCRPEKSHKRSARHTVRRLRDIGAEIAGVIVNDIDLSRGMYFSDYDYYRSRYYYRNRYYAYGYGDRGDSKRSKVRTLLHHEHGDLTADTEE